MTLPPFHLAFPVDLVARPARRQSQREVGDDLMTEEVEVDPCVGRPADRATKYLTVEIAGLLKIADRKG